MNQTGILYNPITDGPVWKGLLSFFFPILFGTFFQQLYNTVDAIVVGQFIGKEALAAAGGGSAVYINLLVGFFAGLTAGSSVLISQFYGAHRKEELSKSIHTSMALSFWAGIFMAAAGALLTPAAMRIIGTPADIFADSVTYLRIYFIGILPMFVYNMGAAVLRALGDSRSPFYTLVAGCGANIALDLLCVAVLKLGIAGAAWATVFSQTLCMIIILLVMMKQKDEYCRFIIRQMKFEKSILRRMIKLGLPDGVQSSLYTISNLIIQADINAFGTITIAAWAAYGRIDSIFWMTISSFGIAITTYAGQNYGACRYDRMDKATKQGLLMMGGTAVAYTILFWFTGNYIFKLFTKDEQVIEQGMYFLHFLAPFFITYISIEVLSGTIHGAGESLRPMIITMAGICVLRVIWLFTAVPLHNTPLTVVGCYPVTWIATSVVFFIYYKKGRWLKKHKG